MTSGFLYDPVFLNHDTGAGHPECRERLSVTIDYLHKQPWFDALHVVPTRPADIDWIQKLHTADYIERARVTCNSGSHFLDSMDVMVSKDSYDIALVAAGSLLQMADQLMANEIDNGFALLRPPGHHAEHDQALGFCLFNNIAILARYLQQQHALEKILILDWDVHHGNGTQHLFETDPSVCYISTHQYPYYPGTGAYSETGIGKGKGATLNCPMPAGANDSLYEQAFMQLILPKIDAFKPDAILISAGFDAHKLDPLAQINMSTEFFGWMTQRVMEMADKHCNGRILSALEGGYNLQMLPLCVAEHVSVLMQHKVVTDYC